MTLWHVWKSHNIFTFPVLKPKIAKTYFKSFFLCLKLYLSPNQSYLKKLGQMASIWVFIVGGGFHLNRCQFQRIKYINLFVLLNFLYPNIPSDEERLPGYVDSKTVSLTSHDPSCFFYWYEYFTILNRNFCWKSHEWISLKWFVYHYSTIVDNVLLLVDCLRNSCANPNVFESNAVMCQSLLRPE